MKHVVTGRALHQHVKDRINEVLGRRPQSWLADEAGVPQSTLSGQMNRLRFSLDVLVRVAAALDRHVADFLPDSRPLPEQSQQAERLIEELEELLLQARRRLGRHEPDEQTRNRDAVS